MYYVYLLKSEKNNRIYIGSTNNLKKRIKEHNKGKVFSTKYYLPWRLIYYEAYDKESLARLREKRLKFNGNALRELKKRLNFLPLKSGAGFTLAEILVVLFIISLLSALTFANYGQGGKQMALQRAAYKLAQDIRRAQEMAISTEALEGTVPPGFGIILRRAPAIWSYKYCLYIDINGDKSFSDPGDNVKEIIDLEKGVFIKEIRHPPPPNSNFTWASINFEPPDPTVNIVLKDPGAYSGEIWVRVTLALEADPNQTKTIEINRAGLIEIK